MKKIKKRWKMKRRNKKRINEIRGGRKKKKKIKRKKKRKEEKEEHEKEKERSKGKHLRRKRKVFILGYGILVHHSSLS